MTITKKTTKEHAKKFEYNENKNEREMEGKCIIMNME